MKSSTLGLGFTSLKFSSHSRNKNREKEGRRKKKRKKKGNDLTFVKATFTRRNRDDKCEYLFLFVRTEVFFKRNLAIFIRVKRCQVLLLHQNKTTIIFTQTFY